MALYLLNAVVADLLLLVLFRHGLSFHLARLYFGPGVLVMACMLIVDVLIYFALSANPK